MKLNDPQPETGRVTSPAIDVTQMVWERLRGCMRYRVTFAKRFESDGEASSIDPTKFLDVADGVVQEKVIVETLEPESMHSQEVMDEDDAFLGRAAAEVWEYEVAEGRDDEFVAALLASGTVMEYDRMDVMDIPTS